MSGVEHRLSSVQERIARAAERAGRDPASVTLIGATKGVDVMAIREAVAAGLRDFGENRIQEALEKIAAVGGHARWHLIGHLQRNKARQAGRLFEMIHSIDSLRIAEAVDRAARNLGRIVPVLVEVNVAGEVSKFGVAPAAVPDLVGRLGACAGLRPIGLMTVAPLLEDAEAVRPIFRALRQLRDRARAESGVAGCMELSMGMSGDFEVAVEEGATMVRVGRAIFGHH